MFDVVFFTYVHIFIMAIFSLPAANMIEKLKPNKSMLVSIILTSIGGWFAYFELYTTGLCFAAMA